MDSMGSSFKLCFSRGTAIAQDFRPRELACFVIFAYFCYRNLDTYNYWYILILLLETQGHETSPYLQQKLDLCSLLPLWSGLVSLSIEFSGGHFWCGSDWFCTCPLQTPRFSAVSTKGRSTVQGLWTRPPTGTKRAWDPVQRLWFLWRKSGDVSTDMAQPSRAVWKIWEMRIILKWSSEFNRRLEDLEIA